MIAKSLKGEVSDIRQASKFDTNATISSQYPRLSELTEWLQLPSMLFQREVLLLLVVLTALLRPMFAINCCWQIIVSVELSVTQRNRVELRNSSQINMVPRNSS